MRFDITLRTRLVLLVLAAIVPLFGLSLVGAALTADKAVSLAKQNLEFSASLVAANQERVADSARQVLTAIANTPMVQEGSDADCRRYLKILNHQALGYANLGIIGLDGYLRCHAMGSSPGQFAGDRSYFQEAIARRSFVASGYLKGRVTDKPIIVFAQPVLGSQGTITAVAFAAVYLSELSKPVADAPLPKGSHLVITDRQAIVLAANPGNPVLIGEKLPDLLLQDAVKAGVSGGLESPDPAGVKQIYAFLPSGKSADSPFFVTLGVDKSEVLAPARQRLALVFLSLALVTFFGSWIAWLLGGRAIVTLTAKILEATRAFQQGRFDVRVALQAEHEVDEFSQIAAGFNRMAECMQAHQGALEAELVRSKASQEKLQDAQRLARIGYLQIDRVSGQIWWSDEIYEIFGVERSLLDGTYDSFLQRIHPADREAFTLARDAAVTAGVPLETEFRVVTMAGEVRWIHQFCRVQCDVDGRQTSRRSGVLQDITEKYQAQAHLRLLETCISRLNDIVMITEAEPTDEPGPRIVFVNDAFERQTGYSGEEVLGQSPRFLQGPKTQRPELDRISAAMKNWQPVRAELINYTKSGREFWNELEIVPIANEKGGFTHWVAVQRDVTQRKLAEQALLDSEHRYAALFDTAPVPMWVYDLATSCFLAANQAAVQAYGYSSAEFLAMTIFDIRPEVACERLRLQLAEGAPAHRTVWQHHRKDGSVFPVNIVSQPIQYAGRAACFVVALDMTAQVKAEKEVQDYLFTLQRAADAAQAITWHQTLEGTMQEIAEQARGVIGAHQAVVSLSGHEHHLPVIQAQSRSEKYAACRGLNAPLDGHGIDAMVCENNRSFRMTQAELEVHPRWRGRGQDADKHPAMRGWLAVPLTGRNGANIGSLQLSDKYEGEFSAQDEYVALELGHLASAAIRNSRLLEEISQLNAGLEQKVAERTVALARQEALFRTLAEQAPQSVWTASPDGGATYFNRAWFDLMGGELKDWTGFQWLPAVHPEDLADIKANWKTSSVKQSAYSGIRRLRARDGSYHTMAYRASPVFDDQGEVTFWVGIDADITEFKAIEAALRLSNQELEAFSYSVSHDLRSPLNTIDGFSRLLSKQIPGDAGEKVKHYLSRIQAGVTQMGQLIEDLLSLSQVTRAPLHTEPVDLSAMARSLLDEWTVRQPDRQVLVHVESGLQAEADGRLIRVAMENLLANAWKFTSQRAQAEISVGQTMDAAGLPVFFVKDNGAGFDMAYSGKLFEPFQRLHAAAEFSGTGIGLATVSRVIKRHGGRIGAESAPGCGATFSFTLPQVRRNV
ncbi:MAG: PAS domain S-box protein [Polaromonas sp.]